MITEPEQFNPDTIIQEFFCVICNNKCAQIYLSNLSNISGIHDIRPDHINGFDIICADCVRKLRMGRRLL